MQNSIDLKKIKIIILDRDGVINHDSPNYIRSPAEWIAIAGSLEAITKLNHSGFKVVVATNQSGVGRGYFSKDTLDAIHQKMQNELAKVGGHLDGIFICPHKPEDNCNCRKPKPGLLEQIQKYFDSQKSEMLFIGDAMRDLEAAKAFGCEAILLKNNDSAKIKNLLNFNIKIFKNLSEAVSSIC